MAMEFVGSSEDAPEANQNRPESEKFPFLNRAEQLWKLIDSGREAKHLGKPPGEILLSKISLQTWVLLDYVWSYIDRSDPEFREPQTLKEYEDLKKNFSEGRKLSRDVELAGTRPEDINDGMVLAFIGNKLMQYEEKFIAEAASKNEQ